jgi:hypothetical protein
MILKKTSVAQRHYVKRIYTGFDETLLRNKEKRVETYLSPQEKYGLSLSLSSRTLYLLHSVLRRTSIQNFMKIGKIV